MSHWPSMTTNETGSNRANNRPLVRMSNPPEHQPGDAFPEPYLSAETADQATQHILDTLNQRRLHQSPGPADFGQCARVD